MDECAKAAKRSCDDDECEETQLTSRPGGFSFSRFRLYSRVERPKRDEKFKVWPDQAEVVKLKLEGSENRDCSSWHSAITADHAELSHLRVRGVARVVSEPSGEAKRRGDIGRVDEFNVVLVLRDADLSRCGWVSRALPFWRENRWCDLFSRRLESLARYSLREQFT